MDTQHAVSYAYHIEPSQAEQMFQWMNDTQYIALCPQTPTEFGISHNRLGDTTITNCLNRNRHVCQIQHGYVAMVTCETLLAKVCNELPKVH